ncbi:MAG: UPF0755 protein, partial [Shewanella sp.]
MKKLTIALTVILLTLLTLASGISLWTYNTVIDFNQSTLKLEQTQDLELKSGTSFYRLISLLEQRGLITDGWKLKVLVKIHPELA